MPLYEYECPKCGRFERLQKLGAHPLRTHDACGSKVTKVMSAGNFAFKGSGFYVTDYGGKSAPASAPRGGACATCPANGDKAA